MAWAKLALSRVRNEPTPEWTTSDDLVLTTLLLREPTRTRFASVQLNLAGPIADSIATAAGTIADADLAAKGRETRPHVTVRYGFHDDDPEGVRAIVEQSAPLRLRFGAVSVFEGEEFDVVKVEVISEDLAALHEQLGALPNTSTHGGYVPHATLAYVRPGAGERYVGMTCVEGASLIADRVTFYTSEKVPTEIVVGATGKWDSRLARMAARRGDRVKAAKAGAWQRIYKTRLAPAEAAFAKKYSAVIRAIQKDTVKSGELKNLKRWKKRLADEFTPWYLKQVEGARAALAKSLKSPKAACLLRTKAAKPKGSWSWEDYEYGTIGRTGEVEIDIERMVREHVSSILGGTLDTLDDRLDRRLEAAGGEGLTAEEVEQLLGESFNEVLDNGHIDDIATTETSWAESNGRLSEMAERGIEWHEWVTAEDDRVRDNHVTYGQQGAIPVGANWAQFVDESYTLRWPHDPDCDEVGEVANCRCIPVPSAAPEDASEDEIASYFEEAA